MLWDYTVHGALNVFLNVLENAEINKDNADKIHQIDFLFMLANALTNTTLSIKKLFFHIFL